MTHRRTFVLVSTALIAVLLTGCASPVSGSAGGPSQQQSFPELLESSRAEATSDFERTVLDRAIKSGSIAAGDYEEAVSKYLDCVHDAGVELDATKQPNGIYKWEPQGVTDLDHYGDVTTRCADGTTMRIEGLYKLQVANPGMLPTNEAIVKCLIDNGIAPNGYDAKQFDKDFAEQFANSDIDIRSELAQMCLNSLGYAVGSN